MSHVDEGTLHALLDGELAPAEVLEVQTHFATCPACSSRLDEARKLLAETERLVTALEPASPLAGQPAPRFARPAAEPPRSAPPAAPAPTPWPAAGMPRGPAPSFESVLIPNNPTATEVRRSRLRVLGWAAAFLVIVSGGVLGIQIRMGLFDKKPTEMLRIRPEEFSSPASADQDRPAAARITGAGGPGAPSSTPSPAAATNPAAGTAGPPGALTNSAPSPARSAPPASTPAPAPQPAQAVRPQTTTPVPDPASRTQAPPPKPTPAPVPAAKPAPTPPQKPAPAPAPAQKPASVPVADGDTVARDDDREAIAARAAKATEELDRERTRERAAAATAALDAERRAAAARQPAASAAPSPAPPPVPTIDQRARISNRIGLDDAARQLGGPLHAIDGMSRLLVGIVSPQLVPGADTTRAVVRAVYVDRSGRLIFLDQQRVRAGQAELPYTPTSGRNGELRWMSGQVLLVLQSDVATDSLRFLWRRVR
jgi:anti-sigma factor RsiW